MNPALITGQIVETMRNDHATSQAGKIMIKRFACLLAVYLAITVKRSGFDHGAGQPLLFLDDAKVPSGQKSKEFNDLGHNPSNASISLFYIMTKYLIFITICFSCKPLK